MACSRGSAPCAHAAGKRGCAKLRPRGGLGRRLASLHDRWQAGAKRVTQSFGHAPEPHRMDSLPLGGRHDPNPTRPEATG